MAINLSSSDVAALLEQGNQRLRQHLVKIKSENKQIVIFGAGEAGRIVRDTLRSFGIEVAFFIDNDRQKWGCDHSGCEVRSPQSVFTEGGTLVIICCYDVDGVEAQLSSLGFSVFDKELYVMCLAERNQEFFSQHLKEICALEQVLQDDKSQKILYNLFLHSLTLDGTLLREICEPNQYFCLENFDVRQGDTFVDGGAFIGDTLDEIINRFGTGFKAIHCFDPEEKNHVALASYIKEHELERSVVNHKMGLSDKHAVLNFSGSGSGFHVALHGEEVLDSVETVTIDDLFADTKVDFIKMDIEGSEMKALHGAEGTIKRDAPRLAICIYHSPSHLWEIPLYIASLLPDYRLFLRHHTNHRCETVIYAIS